MPTQTTQQVILPNEYQQTVGQSQQRQQLIQALAMQLGKQPQGQVVGGVYTGGPNLGSALSQVLGTVLAGRSMDKQQETERNALAQYRTGEQQAIKDYTGVGSPTREAVIGALTSPYSSLQGIAGKDYEQMQKTNTPLTQLVQAATGIGAGGAPAAGGQAAGPSPEAAARLQSLFPGLSMQEIVVGIAADPSGKELYKVLAERGGPKTVNDNATMVLPDGQGGYRPAPGVGAAQAANVGNLSNIKERAKAQWDLAPPVETPGGTSYPTRAQMVGAAGGGGGMSGAPVNLGAPQGQPSLGKIPPQVQASRDQERMAILRQEYANTTNPADRAALEREMSRMTGGMSGSAPAPSGVPGVQVPYNSASKAADKTMRESDAKLVEAAREASMKAGQTREQIGEIRSALKGGSFQNAYGSLQERVAAFAAPLGVNVDPTKLTNSQYIKSTVQNLVVPMVKQLGVNPTDADAKRIDAMIGGLNTDPAAFDKILNLLDRMAEKSQSRYKRMDPYFREKNSLAGFNYDEPQAPAPAGNVPTPESLGLPPGFKVLRRLD